MRRLPAFAYLLAMLAVAGGTALTAAPAAAAAPVAVNDEYWVVSGVNLAIAAPGILANDSDADGNTLAVEMDTPPAHDGAFFLSYTGSFGYTSTAGFTGDDTFTYHADDGTASDGSEDSNVATVTIHVVALPVATADSYGVIKNIPYDADGVSGVLHNDSAPSGGDLSATLKAGPSHGSLTLAPNGAFTYAPGAGYTGADGFDYAACLAAAPAICSTSTHVSLEIANSAPQAFTDSYTTSGLGALSVVAPGLLANDTDENGDPLTVDLPAVAGPGSGTLDLHADGSFTYTPNAGWIGTDSFSYLACDTEHACATGWASIIVPLAVHRNVTATAPAGTLGMGPTGFTAPPAHGTVAFTGSSFTYTPDHGYVGTDVFTPCFDIMPGFPMCLPLGTFSINVINDTPVAENDANAVEQDGSVTANAPGVLANDTDANGDTLTASLVNGPAHGTLTLSTDGSYTYTPAAGYHGADSFTYRACDDLPACSAAATVAIDVWAPNRPPVFAAGVDGATWTLTPGSLPPALTATDPDGDSVMFDVTDGALPGGLTLGMDGTWSGSTTGVTGSFDVTFRACDTHEACTTADVTLLFEPAEASASPSASSSPSSSPTASASPTATASPSASASPSPTASASPTAPPSAGPSESPSASESPVASASARMTPPPTSGTNGSGGGSDGFVVVLLAGLLALACSLALAARSGARRTH